MRKEAKEDLRKSEENLNKVYQELLEKLKHEVAGKDLQTRLKSELQQSEVAWLKFRVLEAKLRTDINTPEGTISGLSHITVWQEITDERTNQLKKYLKDAEVFQ